MVLLSSGVVGWPWDEFSYCQRMCILNLQCEGCTLVLSRLSAIIRSDAEGMINTPVPTPLRFGTAVLASRRLPLPSASSSSFSYSSALPF